METVWEFRLLAEKLFSMNRITATVWLMHLPLVWFGTKMYF